MFKFIKKIFSPQWTREAIQKDFSRRYYALKSKGEDPSCAIYDVIRLSYKVYKVPFTDATLAYDGIPFMLMSFIDIKNVLPDYLMYQMPNELARNAADTKSLAHTINKAFRNPSYETNPNAIYIVSNYSALKETIITALKYEVLWARLLDKDIVQRFINGPSAEKANREQTPNRDMDTSEIESKLDVNKFIEGLDLYGKHSKVIYSLISNTLLILGCMPSSSYALTDDCHLFLLGYIFGYSFKYSLFYEDPAIQEQMSWLTFGAVLEKIYGKATQLTKDSFNRVLDIVCSRKYPTYFECGTNAGENDAIDFLLNIENANRSKTIGIRNLYHFYNN